MNFILKLRTEEEWLDKLKIEKIDFVLENIQKHD